jgi:hypothetical protein
VTAVTFRGADLTAAIIARLTGAGFTVGDGQAPESAGWQGAQGASAYIPYVDVHPSPGGLADGTMLNPYVDVAADYQIISVGATRAQAETVGDAVRASLQGSPLTVGNGRTVAHLRFDMPGGVVRDPDVQPSVFYVSDRWRILTVPS